MAGRLDMQREVVDGVLAGQYYYFPDAVNPAPYPVPITEREILEVARQIATALAESEGSGTRGCFDTQCPRPSIRCHVRGAGSYCQIWRGILGI